MLQLTAHTLIIAGRARVTARGTDTYAYLAADQSEQLDAIYGPGRWDAHITDTSGARWRVVDAFPGMDSLLEKAAS